nr:pirin-like C-terminal cupin domain-containing protein [Kordiimonas pumila]
MSDPHYQEILNSDIPVVNLPNKAGCIRLIAGQYDDQKGAAKTFTPINLWDMRLNAGNAVTLKAPESHNVSLLVLSGALLVNDETLKTKELAQLTREGDALTLDIREETIALFMSGEPIDEPIVGHGPFVMNTQDEIRTAIR